MLGIEFPLLAFSHCRDVVAAVSRARRLWRIGCYRALPREHRAGAEMDRRSRRRQALWHRRADSREHLDRGREQRHLENTGGTYFAGASRFHPRPPQQHGVELTRPIVADNQPQPLGSKDRAGGARRRVPHPIRLIANALGVPPKRMIDMGKKHGVPVARPGRRQGARAGARSRPASISWSCRAQRPAAIAARSPHGAGAGGDQCDQGDARRAGCWPRAAS